MKRGGEAKFARCRRSEVHRETVRRVEEKKVLRRSGRRRSIPYRRKRQLLRAMREEDEMKGEPKRQRKRDGVWKRGSGLFAQCPSASARTAREEEDLDPVLDI